MSTRQGERQSAQSASPALHISLFRDTLGPVSWRVEFLDHRVVTELDALAQDVRQRFLRIAQLIEAHGLAAMHEPHVKHLEGKLWEMR